MAMLALQENMSPWHSHALWSLRNKEHTNLQGGGRNTTHFDDRCTTLTDQIARKSIGPSNQCESIRTPHYDETYYTLHHCANTERFHTDPLGLTMSEQTERTSPLGL